MPLSQFISQTRQCGALQTWEAPPEIGEGPIHVFDPLGGPPIAFAWGDGGTTPLRGQWDERWIVYDANKFYNGDWVIRYDPAAWQTLDWNQVKPQVQGAPAGGEFWNATVDYKTGALPTSWPTNLQGQVYELRERPPGGNGPGVLTGWHLRVGGGGGGQNSTEHWVFRTNYKTPDSSREVLLRAVNGGTGPKGQMSPNAFAAAILALSGGQQALDSWAVVGVNANSGPGKPA